MYAEQGFDSDDEEMKMHEEEADFEKASDDSANAHLVEAAYKLYRKNIFEKDIFEKLEISRNEDNENQVTNSYTPQLEP